MWGGDAFRAAWQGATETAKKAAAAVATGAEKVGAAVAHGVEVAKDKAVDAAKWAADETAAGAKWLAEKGRQGLELGKKAALAAGAALKAVKDKFVEGVKAAGSWIKCKAMVGLSKAFAPQVRKQAPPLTRTEAAARLAKHKAAKEKAELANDVYNEKSGLGPDSNFERVDPKDMPPGLRNATWEDPKSGFKAALYKSKDNPPKYTVAYQGTNMESPTDWKNNFQQALGGESRQYAQAVNLAESVNDAYPNSELDFTGHSLGGGLASAAALSTDKKATVFNAARLSDKSMERLGTNPAEAAKQVDNYYVEGEILTGVQDNAGNIAGGVAGAAGSLVGGPVGGVIGKKAGSDFGTARVGTPVGEQYTIPAVDSSGEAVSLGQANAVDRHGMDYVMNGMDKQIAIDEEQMNALPAD